MIFSKSRKGLLVLLGIFFGIFAGLSPLHAKDTEKPSFKELAATSAVKSYQSGDFEEALKDFQQLEKQYPRNILIKRYISWVYQDLGLRENAVRKLQEAVELDPSDYVTRQMLAETYLKFGKFEEASEQFEQVKASSAPENLKIQAAEKLEEVKKLKQQPHDTQGKKMSAQEFLSSEAVKDFSAGKYERAIYAFQKLEKKYPEDVLLRRFRGLSWARLGKYDQAIGALKEALVLDPQNAAVYYYLGQVYSLKGNAEEARRSYRWVIEHDNTEYKSKAEKEIFQNIQKPSLKLKPWNFSAAAGYEYDTNATFKSRDENFSQAGDQNSGRYLTNLFGNYQFYQKDRFSAGADAFYAQTLYNDFPNLQTYTVGGGLSALYGFNFFSKPVFFNLRDGVMETFLKNRYYVWSNTLTPTLIFILHKKLTMTIFQRWAYNRFAQKVNTNLPEYYNRNGHTINPGISFKYYLNQKRTFYTQAGYDFDHTFTRGVYYRKRANGAFIGLHFPLLEKIEGETFFRFRDSYYPKTDPETRRRDDLFAITVTLSRPLTKNLTLAAYYTYENTKAGDNLYEYYRNLFGIQLQMNY